MVARVLHSFGSGVCEALPVQLVNDIFFLHERGKRIGYYTCKFCLSGHSGVSLTVVGALCFSPIASIPAAYMLSTPPSWRLFFYVVFAFACALFIIAFLFVEETLYDRKAHLNFNSSTEETNVPAGEEKASSAHIQHTAGIPDRKSFLETLRPWGKVDHSCPFFTIIWHSFTYFLIPQVMWVVTTFGINIGLGGLVFNYVFPMKVTAPPYNWPAVSA
jgi:MFS family permease